MIEKIKKNEFLSAHLPEKHKNGTITTIFYNPFCVEFIKSEKEIPNCRITEIIDGKQILRFEGYLDISDQAIDEWFDEKGKWKPKDYSPEFIIILFGSENKLMYLSFYLDYDEEYDEILKYVFLSLPYKDGKSHLIRFSRIEQAKRCIE